MRGRPIVADIERRVFSECNAQNPNTIKMGKNYFPRFYLCYELALDIYSPVRVSTLIISPSSIKSGTFISAPVSRVAGFVAFVAVLPFEAGIGLCNLKSYECGRLNAEYLALVGKYFANHIFLYELEVV